MKNLKRKIMIASASIYLAASAFFVSGIALADGKSKAEVSELASSFIEAVDENNDAALKELLHADMIQYVRLNGNLIPFHAKDFIQMIADKKLGGVPREFTVSSAKIVRDQTAYADVNAVSDEYDFMYHISMAHSGQRWVIVGIIADIKSASK
ncbi:MAG: nuclear transport factor 2 family protein [Bacteroidota bacterium]